MLFSPPVVEGFLRDFYVRLSIFSGMIGLFRCIVVLRGDENLSELLCVTKRFRQHHRVRDVGERGVIEVPGSTFDISEISD